MAEPGHSEISGKSGVGPQKPFEGTLPHNEARSHDTGLPAPKADPLKEQTRLNAVMGILRKLGPKDEKKEKAEQVSPQQIVEARKAWKEHYKGQELKGDERQTVEMLIRRGIKPASQVSPEIDTSQRAKIQISSKDVEKAKADWNEYNKGKTIRTHEKSLQQVLGALGIGPDDPRAKTEIEQLADFLLKPEHQKLSEKATEEEIGRYIEQVKEQHLSDKLTTEDIVRAGGIQRKQKEERLADYEVRGQIDTSGLEGIYLEQVELINNMGSGPEDRRRFDTDFLTRRLERIYDLPIPDDQNQRDQLARIKQRITDLIMGQRQLEEEIRASQGRYFNSVEVRNIRDIPSERERIFEEIFTGVDASPGIEFNTAYSLEARGKMDEFLTIISRIGERSLTREFSGRLEIRQILHNANWGVSGGGDIQTFARAAATYKDEYTDLIFRDPLVETALHFFEQGFQKIKADNNGQLPYEKLEWNYKREGGPGSDLEDIVQEELEKAIDQGIVKDEEGRPLVEVPPWRMQRAIVLARGFGVLSLRFPEITAEARLPEESALSGADVAAQRYASIYGESVARYLDPLEHLIEKFGIGLEDRAILYYFLTGDKGKIQGKEQLERALRTRSQFSPEDKRLIDVINFFRTGGPFSRSSWRGRVSMRRSPGESEEEFRVRLTRSGVGALESRVEGDVDDQIKQEVRMGTAFVGISDADIKSNEKLSENFEKAVNARKDQVMPGEEGMKHREYTLLQRRLVMWKNTLRSNPLRVMWEWEKKECEKKNPGQRLRFLSEALNAPEEEARGLIDEVEKDLMLLQEDVVSLRKPIPENENEEMLNFDLITDDAQRQNVILYVEKIREKAAEGNYRFFREDLLTYTEAAGSPFPFVVGFEDIPFSEYDFINGGGRGISRRINDFAAAAQATNELMSLITGLGTAQSIEPLIGNLVKIKEAVAQADASVAIELVPLIAEGIIRIYDKDIIARLPLGIGTFMGLTGDASFIQKFKGRGAMSWDEGDKYRFTQHLLQNSLIEKDKLGALRRRVGATFVHAGVDFFRTYGQLMLLLMALEFTTRTARGK